MIRRNVWAKLRKIRNQDRIIHVFAVLQALFVTILWSTSWVLIKIGLQDIPPLTFAGLRYTIALAFLLPFALSRARLRPLRGMSRREWLHLIVLGLLFYAATQGAQFLGLAYLPAMSVSLLLNFTTIVVALMSIPLLGERPTVLQWSGICLNAIGIMLFFCPVSLSGSHAFGLVFVAVGVLANAGASILGRRVNRHRSIPALTVTAVSMSVGAPVLLLAGILIQGLPRLNWIHWSIIGWLALVNTAFAFTLWNHTLRTLTAVESNIINGTMLVQIAVLAWLFLGERLSWQQGVGMALAGLGALAVQIFRRPG